jgi:hypothetical protein
MFASATVPRHLLRGLIGVAALIGTAALVPAVGAIGLLGLIVTPIAWRGCPTCWTVGLLQTIGRSRACPAPRGRR